MKKKENMRVIGSASFKNYAEFDIWARDEGKTWAYEENIGCTQITAANLYEQTRYDSFLQRETNNDYKINRFSQIQEYSVEYGIPFELLETNDIYSLIRYSDKEYVIPTRFLEISLWEDMSDKTFAELKEIKGKVEMGDSLAIINDTLSVTGTKSKITEKELELEKIRNDIQKLKEEKNKELERIKTELEERYRKKQEIIQQKVDELNKAMEKMNNELFLLETEIYGIRCLFGETVKFTKIRDGMPAAVEEPVILYQRFRYLDEEMGKLISIYDVEEEDITIFEKFLKSCDYAVDFFAPGEKSISLVRLTRGDTGYTASEKFHNMLEEYRIYHGNRIGIIIRNGENVYLGWTDVDMVDVKDENLFYKPGKQEHEITDEANVKVKSVSKQEVASRYFIFAILQGVLTDGKLMKIPEVKSLLKGGGKYVIFNMAEGYIEDTRFGMFADIMERCNTNIRKGDNILCVQYLSAEQPKHYSTYSNDRGRGDRNRTHDVSTKNNTIYKINLVEKKEYMVVDYKWKSVGPRGEEKWYTSTTKGTIKSNKFSDDVIIIGERMKTKYHYFVSLTKEYSYSDAKANFEVFPNEFINLTFLNSIWVSYAIQNRKVGRWMIGGKEVSYAYSLRYLNKALEFLKQREEEERLLISQYTNLEDEWQVALSEWKLNNNVHDITDYQAKRFAKKYNSAVSA